MSTYKENILTYLNMSRKEEFLTDFTIINNDDTYKVNILIHVLIFNYFYIMFNMIGPICIIGLYLI